MGRNGKGVHGGKVPAGSNKSKSNKQRNAYTDEDIKFLVDFAVKENSRCLSRKGLEFYRAFVKHLGPRAGSRHIPTAWECFYFRNRDTLERKIATEYQRKHNRPEPRPLNSNFKQEYTLEEGHLLIKSLAAKAEKQSKGEIFGKLGDQAGNVHTKSGWADYYNRHRAHFVRCIKVYQEDNRQLPTSLPTQARARGKGSSSADDSEDNSLDGHGGPEERVLRSRRARSSGVHQEHPQSDTDDSDGGGDIFEPDDTTEETTSDEERMSPSPRPSSRLTGKRRRATTPTPPPPSHEDTQSQRTSSTSHKRARLAPEDSVSQTDAERGLEYRGSSQSDMFSTDPIDFLSPTRAIAPLRVKLPEATGRVDLWRQEVVLPVDAIREGSIITDGARSVSHWRASGPSADPFDDDCKSESPDTASLVGRLNSVGLGSTASGQSEPRSLRRTMSPTPSNTGSNSTIGPLKPAASDIGASGVGSRSLVSVFERRRSQLLPVLEEPARMANELSAFIETEGAPRGATTQGKPFRVPALPASKSARDISVTPSDAEAFLLDHTVDVDNQKKLAFAHKPTHSRRVPNGAPRQEPLPLFATELGTRQTIVRKPMSCETQASGANLPPVVAPRIPEAPPPTSAALAAVAMDRMLQEAIAELATRYEFSIERVKNVLKKHWSLNLTVSLEETESALKRMKEAADAAE